VNNSHKWNGEQYQEKGSQTRRAEVVRRIDERIKSYVIQPEMYYGIKAMLVKL